MEITPSSLCKPRFSPSGNHRETRQIVSAVSARLGDEIFAQKVQRKPNRLVWKTRNPLARDSSNDNAGCYHCGATIVSARVIGEQYGVKIKRPDFSDPQGRKGLCDRKAATIKLHMRIHLNSDTWILLNQATLKSFARRS